MKIEITDEDEGYGSYYILLLKQGGYRTKVIMNDAAAMRQLADALLIKAGEIDGKVVVTLAGYSISIEKLKEVEPVAETQYGQCKECDSPAIGDDALYPILGVSMKKTIAPIFTKDDNELFILCPDFVAETKDEAMRIGWGAALEWILFGMKFTDSVLEIDVSNIPHAKAFLGPWDTAIISGPIFEKQSKIQEK